MKITALIQSARAGLVRVLCGLILILFASLAGAATVEYDLTLAREKVDITGEKTEAMTVNGRIPGPTLRFQEGDWARIRVRNTMEVDTSIHWHGLMVPPDMDGVPYISFPPIKPRSTFTYEFPLRQSGTYWYHSHTRFQEQLGVYGAIVIEGEDDEAPADREYTIVLSDWTDDDPRGVLRTLRRGSHWFAVEKGSAQSLIGAVRAGRVGDYFSRELQRMPVMDIADIAYHRFLADGRPELFLDAEPGETVRLRLIDGSASTFFHLNYAGGPMTVIGSDGMRVEPVELDRFLIGVAETYDIVVSVPDRGRYELRATAHDASGFASVWLGTGKKHAAADVPPPNMYQSMGGLSLKKIFALTPAGAMGMPDGEVEAGRFDAPGVMGGMGYEHHPESEIPDSGEKDYSRRSTLPFRGGKGFGYDFIPMAPDISSRKNLVRDGSGERPWPPYEKLKSVKKTAFSQGLPIREIRLTLDGDMDRYVWFIDNEPLSAGDMITVKGGEITRFILINRTMMHHPMHLHGQFFRVINGQGDYSPLKHTVDVPPMSTTVIEFDGSETGDWFFHCHLLYHMESGMARVVHYRDFLPGPEVRRVREKLYREDWFFWIEAAVLSNMTEGYLTAQDTRNIFRASWEVGWERVEGSKWEGTVTYERYLNRFLTIFAGGNFEGAKEDFEKEAGVFGFYYLLPLNIESRAWIDTKGAGRFKLERELALTPRLEVFGEAEYDTREKWESKAGLLYRISKNISLAGQWHSVYGWGGGGKFEF